MKNNQFGSQKIKSVCETKLDISFRGRKENNGWYLKGTKVKAARDESPRLNPASQGLSGDIQRGKDDLDDWMGG
jgi:hypothetical protein